MNKKNNRKGFTIIELVIVIAVIAILATVLVPTFSNIVEKAQDSATLQEARSIYTKHVADVEYAEGETAVENGWIKVDTKYVQVVNSELKADITTNAPAATEHVIEQAADGSITVSECGTDDCTVCDHAAG